MSFLRESDYADSFAQNTPHEIGSINNSGLGICHDSQSEESCAQVKFALAELIFRATANQCPTVDFAVAESFIRVKEDRALQWFSRLSSLFV